MSQCRVAVVLRGVNQTTTMIYLMKYINCDLYYLQACKSYKGGTVIYIFCLVATSTSLAHSVSHPVYIFYITITSLTAAPLVEHL